MAVGRARSECLLHARLFWANTLELFVPERVQTPPQITLAEGTMVTIQPDQCTMHTEDPQHVMPVSR